MPVTKNFTALANITLTDKALMREVGLLARERILRRTAAGQDSEGQAFRPYSQKYAEQKAAALGSTGGVNLQVSGGMLNAITIVEVTDDSVELGFV